MRFIDNSVVGSGLLFGPPCMTQERQGTKAIAVCNFE